MFVHMLLLIIYNFSSEFNLFLYVARIQEIGGSTSFFC